MKASHINITPFKRGESYAKQGLTHNPYGGTLARLGFKRGYNAQLARTAGQPQHKEQPLP